MPQDVFGDAPLPGDDREALTEQLTAPDVDVEEFGEAGDVEDEAEQAEQQVDEEESADEQPKSREARYRVQLRAAEARVGELQALLEQQREQVVLEVAEQLLAHPADALLFGVAGADALGEDGLVDRAKVREMIAGLIEQRPGFARGARLPAPPSFAQGQRSPAPAPSTSWSDVVKPR